MADLGVHKSAESLLIVSLRPEHLSVVVVPAIVELYVV